MIVLKGCTAGEKGGKGVRRGDEGYTEGEREMRGRNSLVVHRTWITELMKGVVSTLDLVSRSKHGYRV